MCWGEFFLSEHKSKHPKRVVVALVIKLHYIVVQYLCAHLKQALKILKSWRKIDNGDGYSLKYT